MEGMTTYTVNLPTNKVRLFRSLTKELGGTMVKKRSERKKCEVEEALDDIKEGRVYKAQSVDDLFNNL